MKRIALCLLALPLCGGAALAEPPHGQRDRPGIERILEENAERLRLDDATREQIRALAQAGRERSAPQRDALRQLRDEMHALLTTDAPEEAAVLAKAEEIGHAETALHKERLLTMLAIRALLTPEQRRELVRIHEEFRAKHPEWGRGGRRDWRERGERQ